MRFTFVILLFCCLGADAQMIIKAHANYRPYEVAAAQNLLLDDYPNAAAAYSLRKLDKDYSGNAIRVRRSNDNSEQDIGFVSSGELDTASLKTFVGANSGFVTTWYDQSGNAKNATQSTAANQPRIVNSGTVERENGKVDIVFDGSNDRFVISTAVQLTSHSIFDVKRTTNTITTATSAMVTYSGEFTWSSTYEETLYSYGAITGDLTNERQSFLIVSSLASNPAIQTLYGYGQNSANITGQKLNSIIYNGNTTLSFYENGTSISLVNPTNGAFSSVRYPNDIKGIGYRYTNNLLFYNGSFQEIVIYASDESSNRTGIQTNINTYYSIY